jgi:hypothetical protein
MPQIYSMDFAGIDAFCIETENGTRSCLLDGKIFEPQEYDKIESKIISLVGIDGFQKMRNEIQTRLSKLSDINSSKVFDVYASLRDKIRSTEFVNA